MNTMNRIALGLAALFVPFTLAPAAGAARPWDGVPVYDMCKSDWIKALGNPPCETMTDPAQIRCDLDRPYYVTPYRFRYYTNGAWSPWWLYARSYRPAPKTAC